MSKIIPRSIVGAFVVFCTGALVMVYLSTQNPSELVDEDYYALAIGHDETMAAKANALSVKTRIQTDPQNTQGYILSAINPAWSDIQVSYSRPSDASLDRDEFLTATSDSVVLNTSALAAGPWNVRVSWQTNDKLHIHEQRIIVQK